MTAAWNKIKLLMDNSVFFRLIERFMGFTAKLFSGSVLVRFLSKDTPKDRLMRSFIYRAALGLFTLPEKLRDRFFMRVWEGSAVVRFARWLPRKCLSFTFTCADTKANTAADAGIKSNVGTDVSNNPNTNTNASARVSVYDIIRHSAVMRFISYLFDFTMPPLENAPRVNYPFIGLLAIVFLAPFIPTMMTAALIVGVFLLFILKLLTDKNYSVKLDLTGLFLCIFILITLFKGFTSLTPATSVNIALLTSLFMAVYFLVISVTDTRKKFEILIFTFSTSALFTGFYGFMQVLSGQRDMTWVDKKLFEELGMRVFSTFANPNVYGEYLLLAIPVALAGFVIVKRPLMKLYYLGVSAALTANLALTYSRGCYLAIAFAVLIFVLIMEKRLVAFFSMGIFIVPAVLPAAMLNRLLSIGNMEDSSSKYRLSIYQATVRILKQFWPSGLGQGAEAFNRVFPLFTFNGVTASHSHNLFLQVFVETGVFGFIAFLAVILCFFKSLFPFFYNTRNLKYKCAAAALIAMMAGFILQSLFDYSLYNYKVYMLFFVTLALARVCAENGELNERA